MRYLAYLDVVVGSLQGNAGIDGTGIPESTPIDKLRYDGTNIVDATALTDFFIDADGLRHIVQHDPAWQALTCNWGDALINDAATWRVKTAAENLDDYRAAHLETLKVSRNAALSAGFISNALGADHSYDSASPFDHVNVSGAAQSGVALNFTCTDSAGVKTERMHSAVQMAQVFADGMAHVQTHNATYDSKRAAVRAAVDPAAVDLVTWA